MSIPAKPATVVASPAVQLERQGIALRVPLLPVLVLAAGLLLVVLVLRSRHR